MAEPNALTMTEPTTDSAPSRPVRSPDANPLVEITGLKKRFGTLEVLCGLDLTIPRGAVTAIVGPNASGKTTLIKTLLGLVRPDAGTLRFDGEPLERHWQYRAHIGYMPQEARFPENLSAREVLAMLRDLRSDGTPTDETLISLLNLEPELDKPLRTLSGGTRQKVSAAIAFLFQPKLIIMDEPTAGLDPVASSALKDQIRRAQREGTTFILASHIMGELDELADYLVVLIDGTIRFAGSPEVLKRSTGQPHLERAIAQMMQAQHTP